MREEVIEGRDLGPGGEVGAGRGNYFLQGQAFVVTEEPIAEQAIEAEPAAVPKLSGQIEIEVVEVSGSRFDRHRPGRDPRESNQHRLSRVIVGIEERQGENRSSRGEITGAG